MRTPRLSICLMVLATLAACGSMNGQPGEPSSNRIGTGRDIGDSDGNDATKPRSPIDGHLDAISQSSRVSHLVLHYTVANLERSLVLLTRARVSSHYLITDEEPARVLQLVDESRSAWHAGQSSWYARSSLNASSIGIEIVNRGDARRSIMPGMGTRDFQAYTSTQLKRVAVLMADIVERHKLAPENIVAHGDIEPQRKHDPGPLFPWRALAAQGLGRWFDEPAAARTALNFERIGLPPAAWFQVELARVGYEVPRHGRWDAPTRRVLSVFQMRYRPERYDGAPDANTAGILTALPTRGSALGQPQLNPSTSTQSAQALVRLMERVTPRYDPSSGTLRDP